MKDNSSTSDLPQVTDVESGIEVKIIDQRDDPDNSKNYRSAKEFEFYLSQPFFIGNVTPLSKAGYDEANEDVRIHV